MRSSAGKPTDYALAVASALIPDPLIQESDIPEGTFLLNDKITLSLAQKLRIRSAREAVFADKFFENGGCEDWTQKQAPSHQIAKLLKQQVGRISLCAAENPSSC